MRQPQAKMTVDEFLAWAEDRPGRYELLDGIAYAMVPERAGHARAKARAHRALEDAVARAGLPCEAMADGMTVRIDARTAYEPDALVYCGDPVPNDAFEVPAPVIVVEVLSPGTRGTDTGLKLAGYFTLPSVRHYLLIDPAGRVLVHHARDGDAIATRIVASGLLTLDPPRGSPFPSIICCAGIDRARGSWLHPLPRRDDGPDHGQGARGGLSTGGVVKQQSYADMTVEDFVVWNEAQEERHEIVDGQVYAMAPERVGHAETKFAVQSALKRAIDRAGVPCHMLPDGMTVRIDARTAYEPDALVYCGPRLSRNAVEVPAPVIVVEVLSPSTGFFDRHDKLAGYIAVPGIRHYLIVNIDRRIVIHHARDGEAIRTRLIPSGPLRLDPPGLDLTVEDLLGPGLD